MGTVLRRSGYNELQRVRVNDVDDAGLPDRHVQMVERRVEEDHVRLATQPGFVQGLARRRIDGDECTLIARAEQTAALRIDVEAVRPPGRYRIGRSNSCRVVCFHDNDHGWLR